MADAHAGPTTVAIREHFVLLLDELAQLRVHRLKTPRSEASMWISCFDLARSAENDPEGRSRSKSVRDPAPKRTPSGIVVWLSSWNRSSSLMGANTSLIGSQRAPVAEGLRRTIEDELVPGPLSALSHVDGGACPRASAHRQRPDCSVLGPRSRRASALLHSVPMLPRGSVCRAPLARRSPAPRSRSRPRSCLLHAPWHPQSHRERAPSFAGSRRSSQSCRTAPSPQGHRRPQPPCRRSSSGAAYGKGLPGK